MVAVRVAWIDILAPERCPVGQTWQEGAAIQHQYRLHLNRRDSLETKKPDAVGRQVTTIAKRVDDGIRTRDPQSHNLVL